MKPNHYHNQNKTRLPNQFLKYKNKLLINLNFLLKKYYFIHLCRNSKVSDNYIMYQLRVIIAQLFST